MESLTTLDDCIARALDGLAPVAADNLPMAEAVGAVLAEPLRFPADMPPVAEALRAGFAVAALDLTGASASVPIPLVAPVRLLPADPLPPGSDAVLPPDWAEATATGWEAIRPIGPGDGVRRAGHDGRAGTLIAPAGAQVTARLCLVAGLSGLTRCTIRRPRVAIDLPDPHQAGFARACLGAMGAEVTDRAPHLILRPTADAQPRLALAPAQTAWLEREGGALVLSVPRRFDGMVAAVLALALPAMAALTGAAPRYEERPLLRKIASGLGMAELVLLTRQGADWHPAAAGAVTLASLAMADAIAILPPDSEGLAAGAPLAGTALLSPFG